MRQNDTISVQSVNVVEQQGDTQVHKSAPTPRQILSWLPKNATPAQQDSAIQRYIKPQKIRWSNQPDTLHLPGLGKGTSYRDTELSLYYRENFFSNDTLYHPELRGGQIGVAGEPVPYNVANDNLITSLLLGCFILAAIAFANSRRFILHQVKKFFYAPREQSTMIETSGELQFQLFLMLQTCLLSAILYFFYIRATIGNTFSLEHYQVIGIYAGILVVYFIFKTFAYWACGLVFFDKRRLQNWLNSFMLLTSLEGVMLFPIVMLKTFFNLSTQNMIICTIGIVGIFKLLSFYRAYLIFMYRNGGFLHIFLYFCALELTPLLALWSVLKVVSSYLEINF